MKLNFLDVLIHAYSAKQENYAVDRTLHVEIQSHGIIHLSCHYDQHISRLVYILDFCTATRLQ